MTTQSSMAGVHTTQQRIRLVSWVSWILLGLTLLAIPSALALQQMGCGNLLNPSAAEPAVAYGLLMLPLHALAFSLVGTLINSFRPDNRFGWLASGYGFALMWLTLIGSYGECAIVDRAALPGGDYAIWLNNLLENLVFLSLAFMPWLFPDGRFLSSRWKRVGLIGITLVLLFSTLNAFWPAPLRVDPLGRYWIENPLGFNISPAPWLDQVVSGGGDIVVAIFLAGIVSLVLRWRRSAGETRQQLKWLTYHLATSGTLFMAVEIFGSAFYPAIFNGWFYLIVLLLFWLGLPIVIGLAIFKYRLYDIDIIIRRTVVYALLTAILALVFFGIVILASSLLTTATGQNSPVIIVMATLTIAALFTPSRRRIQNAIDRRFNRRKYDAEQVLAIFARTARDETDLNALSRDLIHIIEETVQPAAIALWMREDK